MPKTLKLVLTDHWFEEIKSGRKTHEYRKATIFWTKRILRAAGVERVDASNCQNIATPNMMVQFQKAYRKNPERMTFEIKAIYWLHNGKNTDLQCDAAVFDIELGGRIYENEY